MQEEKNRQTKKKKERERKNTIEKHRERLLCYIYMYERCGVYNSSQSMILQSMIL